MLQPGNLRNFYEDNTSRNDKCNNIPQGHTQALICINLRIREHERTLTRTNISTCHLCLESK